MADELTFSNITKASINELLLCVRKNQRPEVEVDCHTIQHIDSCGLALLTEIKDHCKTDRISFTHIPKQLQKLAELYLNKNQKLQ